MYELLSDSSPELLSDSYPVVDSAGEPCGGGGGCEAPFLSIILKIQTETPISKSPSPKKENKTSTSLTLIQSEAGD